MTFSETANPAMPVDLDPARHPTLSVDETAVVFEISRGAAFAAVKNGEIPSIRFGRRIRVPTAAVRAMLGLDSPTHGGPDAA